jgi:PAS domain S-box-containing protein
MSGDGGPPPRANEELEDFFENGAIGLHIVGGDGTILRANKAELALLGYGAAEYIGHHIGEFHADPATISDILARLGRGERLDRYPARLRAKDGSIRHVLITSSALFKDGEFIHTRCFTVDVTEARAAERRLKEGELQFRAMLEALPVAIYTTDADGIITFYNRTAAELAGREPTLGADRWCVTWRLFDHDGTPLPLDQCPMAIALKEQRPIRGAELIAERPDGTRARVVPHPTPLFDNSGGLVGAINMLVDVTERHAAEEDSARLAAILLSSQDAIVGTDRDGRVTYWGAGAEHTYGYERHEMVGQSIARIIPPELIDQELQVLDRARRGESIENYETERLTKDGRRVSISLSASAIRDKAGKVVGIAKVGRDITERKRAEITQNLMIGELNHRVKNTLSTVQAIARQTLRKTGSPTEFANNFSGRLQSLAHAHSLLTDNLWRGADFATLVRDQILLGGDGDDRITFSGPSVSLTPQAALHMALVLHELGTNARKYGSLSVMTGKLSLNWTVRSSSDGLALHIRWSEQGGPPVTTPSRRGFGTTLIEKSLQSHGGTVVIDFGANGVTCDIELPLSDDADMSSGAYRSITARTLMEKAPSELSIRNKRILVVEDEPLVAMDLVATLEEEGCEVVGPAGSVASASTLIEQGQFDAALLDANLGGQPVDELAAALTRRNIKFAFVTGYGRQGLPESFRSAPLIAKPYVRSELLAVLVGLLRRDTGAVSARARIV